MKAAVLEEKYKLNVLDVPYPVAEPGWALVKVHACGICGSDVRYFEGENPWALHTLGYNKPNLPNIILGHEFAGEIIAVGSEEDQLRVGERVGILAYRPCGKCVDCDNGNHNLCANMLHIGHAAGWPEMKYYPGGMAEVCQVPISSLFPIPKNVSYEEAACCDFIAVAYHSMYLAGDIFNKTVVVFGCGPVGNCIAQLARSHGAEVIVIESNQGALDILQKQSFKNILRYNSPEAIKQKIHQHTDNRGVFTVWDSVGTEQSVMLGLSLLENNGSYINLATHNVTIPIPQTMLASERKMMSSSNNKLHFYPNSLKAVGKGLVDVKSLISRKMPLNSVKEAFALLRDKDGSNEFKIIISPNS